VRRGKGMSEKDLNKRVEDLEEKIDILLESFSNVKEQEKIKEEKEQHGKMEYQWYLGYGADENDVGFTVIDPNKKYKVENCLKEIIRSRGLLLGKVAELVGIDRSTLSGIVNSTGSSPSIFTVLKICGLLKVNVDQAFRLVEEDDVENIK
jgi:DNA-binding XRE family transcriptional regulator